MTDLKRRTQLGETGPSVFPIALGCMAMSGAYGPSDENEGTRYPEAAMQHLDSEK